jgi:prepilin-type N-terminal cleavage/methylation domain-containing protein
MRTQLIRRQDSGFTLIEMLMVIAVVGLIATVLAMSISVFARNNGSVSSRVTETRDLQNLTNFLPVDVASARTITTTPSVSAECGTGGTVQLHLEWSEDWNGSLYKDRITYRLLDSPRRLVRYECENSAAATSFTVARAFDILTVNVAMSTVDPTKQTGTVYLQLTYPDGVRRLSATSRNFLPVEA